MAEWKNSSKDLKDLLKLSMYSKCLLGVACLKIADCVL